MKKAAFFLIAFFLVHITGRAEDVTWTGAKSQLWRDPQNWSTGKVPGSNDNVIIPSGTPTCAVGGEVTVSQVNNSGTLRFLGDATVHTSNFTNSGQVVNQDATTTSTINGVNDGKVEVTNTGTIQCGTLAVQNGSTVTNNGTISAVEVNINSNGLTNGAEGGIDAITVNVKSNDVKNYGTIQASTEGSDQGITMQGQTFLNSGTIDIKIGHKSKDPAIEMTFQKKVVNDPNAKITISYDNSKKGKVAINSPMIENYGKITGYKTTDDDLQPGNDSQGMVVLVGDSLIVDYTTLIQADKIRLVFHWLLINSIMTMHGIEATSGIEIRGDAGSLFEIMSTCAADLFYSAGGQISILCDSARTDSVSFQYICNPDPQTGPADTTFISGFISSTNVLDSSNNTGTFRVYLQNQGTCHKAFQYSIISPHGWITPVSGTTQVLKPFQYDSLEIHYSIPSHPTVKTESILQVLSVPGSYSDTSYSFITVTDSINLGIDNKFPAINGFSITVCPNPFNQYCTIISNRDAQVCIYDLFGRMVFETSVMKGKAIDWYPAPETGSGCYIIFTRYGNQYTCKKAFFIK